MNILYTLTLDDYREAARAHQGGVGKAGSRTGTLVLVVGTVTAVSLFASSTVPGPARTSSETFLNDLLIPAPFLVFVASLVIVLLLSIRARIEPRNVKVKATAVSARRWRGTIGWICFFGMAAAFTILRGNASLDQNPVVAPWAAELGPRLPWILMLAMLVFFAYCSQFGALRKAWRGQPNLHGQHEAEIVAKHVIIATPASRSQLMWNGILCFAESESLFLLYPSLLSFHIIPKRAFTDEAQLIAFRNMLDHLVKPTKLEATAPATSPVLPRR
jgi:YcxB-like protein